jgi:ABC-type multidrug transport system permease subunit
MGAWRIVPGLIGVAILFSASSMGQVVVSFDRMSGGFEIYMHAPMPPDSVVIGKAAGGTVFGLVGSAIAGFTLYLVTGSLPVIHPLYLAAGLLLGSAVFSLLAVAVSLAWEPLQAVTALNALRFSMVFLGGLIPATVIPAFLYPLVWSLPMCYITDLIRYGTFNVYEYVDPLVALAGSIIYLIVLFILARRLAVSILYP